MPSLRRIPAMLTALSVSVLLVVLNPAPSVAARPDRPAPPSAHTSQREAARVDAVPTPRLHWTGCDDYLCSTAQLPLDYDHPHGPTVRVALLKVPAADPAHRIGSLFLNPGGPGGSGKDIARRATQFLSPEVLDRFDLIGMDPRGTNDSTRLECYSDAAAQAKDTDVLGMVFPADRAEELKYGRAVTHLARTCSSAGQPLAAAMSTAEVARDMDVLRRAVGDRRLNFLGWSYGTYLGQVYASLFPDRLRTLAIDGVVDAVAWRGTAATRRLPLTLRVNSAAASSRALTTVLQRCRQAGAPRCPLMPDPEGAFAQVAAALRAAPLTVTDEDGATYQIPYAGFVHDVLLTLYQPDAAEYVPQIVDVLRQLIDARTPASVRRRSATRYGLVLQRVARLRQHNPADPLSDPASNVVSVPRGSTAEGSASRATPTSTETPLDNEYELNAAVTCSDSLNPHSLRRWAALSDPADRRAPYFGRFWLWTSSSCARWTARDEDAYRGPLDRRTSAPVLVVGNYYDPATNYDSAVSVARRLPNSRLLSSDSWGHTAYGTSSCVTAAMDAYLISRALPARGTVCIGDVQPFEGPTPAATR
jgi:pimeloyl-ACP methyl ester carboxylesterase